MAVRFCNWLWRILVAAVFLMAVYGKWQEGINYLLTPPVSIYDRMVHGMAYRHYGILAIETIVALWLLSGRRIRWASTAAGVMMVGFIVLQALELRAQYPADCGCGIHQIFPDGDPVVALKEGIVRNCFLLFGCLWLWFLGPDEKPRPVAAAEPDEAKQTTGNAQIPSPNDQSMTKTQ